MILIENPFPLFTDNNGQPLESGYIYIGTAGLNAEVNQINVFWDKDSLYPAAQPIRTTNGLPARGGTPSPLYTASVNYSVLVKDKNQELVSSASYYPTAVVPADDTITVAMYTAAAYPVLLVDNQTAAGDKTWTGKTANKAVTPTYELEETGAAVNSKIWQLVASAGQFIFRVSNDAKDTFASIFTVDRTGTTVDIVDFKPTYLQHNGANILTSLDSGDDTKKIVFDASGITTSTTRTITVPDADMEFDFGQYAVTETGVTNITTPGVATGRFTRVGDHVHVYMNVAGVGPTAGSTYTTLRVSLPVSSNFTAASELIGSGSVEKTTAGLLAVFINADTTNDEALINFYSANTSTHNLYVQFMYKII